MKTHLEDHQFAQALAAVDDDTIALEDKVQMLMEIAMGLQQRPKTPQQLLDAIALYERAISLCPDDELLVKARLQARQATALQIIPTHEPNHLLRAQACLEAAIPVLSSEGTPAETAEAQMNYGVVLQSLASAGYAPIQQAINAYQRALRIFTRAAYPTEFAILHNNLASAFLAIPSSDESAKMREALAVQSFEAALEAVTLVDNPREYAMLQNNLGNALQYASSAHALENNLRALQAYDEALKVRTATDTPLEFANTLANKGNCLRNLPDDPDYPSKGNRTRLMEAKALYGKAQALFKRYGETHKAGMLEDIIADINSELGNGYAPHDPASFGLTRIAE